MSKNPDEQRRTSLLSDNQQNLLKKISYVGEYEKIETGGNIYEVHYINTPEGLSAIAVKENGNTEQYYYTETDHLGSLLALYDENGQAVFEQSFDAWGRERNPIDWTYTTGPYTKPAWLIRGYTGHEMLPEFSLINMNGRMYDPILGRMLSPDNYVQDATNTQGYNRYSYVLNNPLKYTDPSGEFLAIAFMGMAFTAEFMSNGINGYGWNAGTAYKSAHATTADLGRVAQFPIYKSENTTVTAGVDPFALGVSVNAYNTQGNVTTGVGVGIGMLSGPFANAGISYSAGDWNVGIGGGAFGSGFSNYGIGANVSYLGYGLGYTFTHYGAGTAPSGQPVGAQNTGTLTGYWPGGSFRIENDFFAFQGEDRWRTSSWELTVGDYSIGSYIYTNDPKGEGSSQNDNGTNWLGKKNKHGFGAWEEGYVYSSPLWFGYRVGNSISRVGYSHPLVQDRTQNVIHKSFPPGYQNFYNQYTPSAYGSYGYSGYYNPYSLYGR